MRNPETRTPIAKTREPASPAVEGRNRRGRLRDDFFRNLTDAKQLLEPFNHIPDVLYFVKDAENRLMAVSPGVVARMGFQKEEEIIGRPLEEFLPPALAAKYLEDDLSVVRHGKPLRNIVEMYYNARGVCDYIITDKYPLRDAGGRIVGLIGTVRTIEGSQKLLAHLGPVGKAADFIRAHLGESVRLPAIARHAGFSERQLQRLFLRVFRVTIQQFIIQSRVQGAIRELIQSDRAIAEIAAKFGFSDQSAFTNQFRAVTGVPPGTYRKRYFAQFTPQ
jgi:AraC-like DNA-binding protein